MTFSGAFTIAVFTVENSPRSSSNALEAKVGKRISKNKTVNLFLHTF